MSSILTNTSAMVALQTLKGVNSNLEQTQAEISTGKSINSAKDNSSVWAISKVMESDVKGFQGISESLALGESTVAVALNASETITDLLTEMKGRIVAAQESNVDREKIQSDVDALRGQIESVVGAAQFNGLNLIEGDEDVSVLSSLDRANDGSVNANYIAVDRQDLTTKKGEYGTTALSGATLTNTVNVGGAASGTSTAQAGLNATLQITEGGGGGFADGDTFNITVGGSDITVTLDGTEDADGVRDAIVGAINARDIEGIEATNGANAGEVVISNTNAFEGASVQVAATLGDTSGGAGVVIEELNGATVSVASGDIGQRAETVDFSATAPVDSGDGFEIQVAGATFRYVAGEGETMEDVARGLKTAIDSNPPADVSTQVQQDETTGAWSLALDYDNASTTTIAVGASTGGEASGGLFGLDNIDVTTDQGATAALDNIETLIQNSIDSAASFGSVQGRIETQAEFVSKLTDSLKTGIGAMVDADMEEASARLQALQVQQQLAVQSLSIANQAPQTILSLFR